MTNRDMVILALQDGFDDPGLTKSIITDSIDCPHMHTTGHPCDRPGWDYPGDCYFCKMEWLDEEVEDA